MSIPGNKELPKAVSGQQQPINFSNAIPIKKRRFPVIQPASPPQEENPCESEDNKRESNIVDERQSFSTANVAGSPANSDVSKTCASIVEKEVITPTNTKLAQATVTPFASKPQEAKTSLSLGLKDDLKNKSDISLHENLSKSEVQCSSMASRIMNVNQEIPSEKNGPSVAAMNVELSIGPKQPHVPALEQQNSESFGDKSERLDPLLLSLSLSKEKPVLHDNAINNVSSGAGSNRSNWDLNTTMDAWENSTNGDGFAHRFVDTCGLSKTNNVDNAKCSLTTALKVDLCLNKGKNERIISSSNTPVQQFQQGKIDDSVGLRLGMPYSAGPNLNLQQVQLSAMNLNISGRAVKSEPVEENPKRDSSIGSRSSSSNMDSSKFSSMKRELVENNSRDTLLPSSVSPVKLFDNRSIKSELVLPQSVGSVMQHQESCASSKLSTCLELTKSGDVHDHNDKPEGLTAMVSRHASEEGKPLKFCNVGNSNVENLEKCEIGQAPECTLELCGYKEVAVNDEEKINIPAEVMEDGFCGSDFESHENCALDACMDVGEKIFHKEDEYEDGEIREPIRPSSGEDANDEGKKTENVEREYDSRNLQLCINLGDQDVNASEFGGKSHVIENHDEIHSGRVEESVMIGYERHSEDNSLQNLSKEVLEVGVYEKRCISVVTPEKQIDLSGIEDVEEGPGVEFSSDRPTNGSDKATDEVVKEVCSEKQDSALDNVEASVNSGNDADKDSNNAGNKSRIINLSRASVVTSPCKTKPVPNMLLASRSGKERCYGPVGEIQPRGYRAEVHTDGLNKYANDRDYNSSFRNSRPSFTRGRGRGSGRFGSSRGEWDSNHDFTSENYNGPSDYRPGRRKHASSIPDGDRECNGYDGSSFGSNRRKAIMNDEFSLSRRPSFRRLSPGDRDGPPVNRGNQILRRVPRNISPNRCDVEDNSNMVGFRHGDKLMRHLSDDMIDPVYARPQAIYDEVDDRQPVRGNRNFSTMQRKSYPRIRSKSPIRLELNQSRSPAVYRTGRMRSPGRDCFRGKMTVRRRGGGSPSFVPRHPNDSRDVESHHRSADSNRRSLSPPPRAFQRNSRRADALDSREMGDGDEYIDDRRKFIERQRPVRSFRPSYDGDGDNFHFHSDDGGPRPYRYCPDVDTEFVERSNMQEREFDGREREFDGRVKHQHVVVSRQIRNIEEQQDGNGNYRPGGRVWHDDGFGDGSRGKRRRF